MACCNRSRMRFKVHDTVWEIVAVEARNNVLTRSDGSRSLAVTDNTTKTVYISERTPKSKLGKVVCHEICHVLCFENHICLSMGEEERLANFVAEHGREVYKIVDLLLPTLM